MRRHTKYCIDIYCTTRSMRLTHYIAVENLNNIHHYSKSSNFKALEISTRCLHYLVGQEEVDTVTESYADYSGIKN